ncbi:MAG: hypothetical protein E5Y89_02440 [Mesorhizobium sp.]|nr:MAG: hypothetical protein E5Y89_02440 [Mesorhizobium sp.]
MFRFTKKLLQSFNQPLAKPAESSRVEVRPPRQRVIFRATSGFLLHVRQDLERRHAFALERVGFITVRAAQGAEGLVLLAEDYYPVADEHYVHDRSVGAMIGSEALRKALELALLKGVGVFHVHMHGLTPRLWFSLVDLREQVKFIPDFFTVCPQMPHGAIVLNAKTAAGRVWLGPDHITQIDEFNTIGPRMMINGAAADGSTGYYA